MKIELKKIRLDGNTQPRVQISEHAVQSYTEVLLDGKEMPPVDVFFDGAEYWLADGFHRYHATKANATATIEAEVHQGSVDDAQEYSFGANKNRGLDMTNDDKKEIIRKMFMIERYKGWTQEEWMQNEHWPCGKMNFEELEETLDYGC